MLELYHSVNSVCAQKARIALVEKGIPYIDRLMTLRGDQYEPAYLKLNPNAVVPTLVHDGRAVTESSVILYYIDEVFPAPALMPLDPHARAKVRMYNKLVDEYVHNSCMILTFGTAFRGRLAQLPKDALDGEIAKTPIPKRADYKRDVIAHGLQSQYIADAVRAHEKLLGWMEQSLAHSDYLAGKAYSLADIAVIPYILRLDLIRLAPLWAKRASVAAWYERMKARPAYQQEIANRMTEADWAPFKGFQNQPDPWPQVVTHLKAA